MESSSFIFLPNKTTTTPTPTKKKKKSQKLAQQRRGFDVEDSWPKKKGAGGAGRVTLEGYVEPADGAGSDHGGSDSGGDLVGRTRSLTDEDLEELKGCLDLGFGFSYDEIPELCSTLPALELCYSMSQRFLDEQQQQQRSPPPDPSAADAPAAPVANWKFSSPGDDPEEVKARLKYWAQAVACTVKLCN
ncbi:uncharacterized protein M6B38_174760 [Iris pallida]|uniref:Uncharacterized protein n=1 Tax=Iris pallida TaxID=29817 RepID=A0AAX6ERN2_IRIPA|nr:uncharacterized protein M6B38_174760 [Iris pallida]